MKLCDCELGVGHIQANAFIQPQSREVPNTGHIMDSAERTRVLFLKAATAFDCDHVAPSRSGEDSLKIVPVRGCCNYEPDD